VASVFTRIIRGELPARFVWQDRECVAFLSIAPLRPGHTLVVPRLEIDHWVDADPGLLSHLTTTARVIGKAQMAAFHPTRIGMVIAGLEVPHLHLHVVPIRGMQDLNFANADTKPEAGMMDAAAAAIRNELRGMGFEESSGND
jgi:histidine triad (HIT) family protein